MNQHTELIDALGNPRQRYTRLEMGGSHCVMSVSDAAAYLAEAAAADESGYKVTDIWLSESEFENLPEHDGF